MGNPHQGDVGDEVSMRARGLTPSHLSQLRRDLLLTPEERVRAAEETLKLDRLREVDVPRRVIGFERYEDYLDYKWKMSAGGA